MRRPPPLVFIAIGVFVSGYFANLGWGYYSKAKAAETWPSVPGKITKSFVGRSGKMYEARIAYNYEVNGQKLNGEHISLMDGSSSNSGASERLVDELPVGKEVKVYYNPKVPVEAYLNPSAGMTPFLMMGGGCLGLLLTSTKLLSRVLGGIRFGLR